MVEIEMCPFCPLMGIEPELYLPIGNDFHGQPAKIGDVRSCEACATRAQFSDSGTVEKLLEELRVSQKG